MRDDLISRTEVMRSLTAEYDRRSALGEKDGLRLAWIEKAVNETPSVEPNTAEYGSVSCMNSEKTHDRTTDDLISRQAAIEVVHKWLSEVFGVESTADSIGVFKRLRKLPSAQPIRCGECKHWEKAAVWGAFPEYHGCAKWETITTLADDFCSRAERRDDATDRR